MPFCSRGQLARIESLLEELLLKQRSINQELRIFMSTTPVTLAQLTTDVNTLQSALTTGLTDISAEIAALKTSNPTVDFSSLDSVVQNMISQVKSADPGAQSTGTGSTAGTGSSSSSGTTQS